MTSAPAPPLDLHSSDDLDVQFDAERATMLRRRFLWLCAVSAVIALGTSLPSVDRCFRTTGRELVGALIAASSDALLMVCFIGAFFYALRTAPKTDTFLRLAFLFFVAGSIFSLVAGRISLQLDVVGWLDTEDVEPAHAWLFMAPLFIGPGHLATSLFMPWRLRESLVPAAIVLAALTLTICVDVLLGNITMGAGFFASVAFSALSIAPGAMICWLRFSRIRERFEHRYFSAAYRALRHELATARKIHESLLPPQKKDGPIRLSYVYEPMREIGGDLLFIPFFTALRAPAVSILNAVLLDVTGHGVAAALTVNRLVGELERLFAERPDAAPGDILGALNRYVCLTLAHHNIYATAICLRIDAAADSLEYASGGHPPAFFRSTQGEMRTLDSTAPMLGVLEADLYLADPRTLPFHAGDVLMAYTDGANEARDVDGNELGILALQRLTVEAAASHPSPATWPANLLDRIRSHRAGAAEDDTLLLTLSRPRA